MKAVPVAVDGPVPALSVPSVGAGCRTFQVSTTPIRVANMSPRRRRLLLIADGAFYVGPTPNEVTEGYSALWPAGVPYPVSHRDVVYVRAESGGSGPVVEQSLFTSAPVVGNADDGQPINTGTTLTFGVAGQVTHMRMYAPTGGTGDTYTGTLYRLTSNVLGTALGSVTFTSPLTAGFNTAEFVSPIDVLPTDVYRARIHASGGNYVATLGLLASALTNGDITAPGAGALTSVGTIFNGSYDYGAAALPTSNGSGAAYFADVVFVAEGSGDGAGPVNISLIEEGLYR